MSASFQGKEHGDRVSTMVGHVKVKVEIRSVLRIKSILRKVKGQEKVKIIQRQGSEGRGDRKEDHTPALTHVEGGPWIPPPQ